MKKKSAEYIEPENRFQEERYFETRDWEQEEDDFRRQVKMSYEDPFYIDPSIVPMGMEYAWKRQYIFKMGGEEDTGNLARAYNSKWTPVPASRHPYLAGVGLNGDVKNEKGYIEKGGQVLCERPDRFGRIEREVIARTTYERTYSNEALRGNPDFIVQRNSFNTNNNLRSSNAWSY
jgi:hypothetical protein